MHALLVIGRAAILVLCHIPGVVGGRGATLGKKPVTRSVVIEVVIFPTYEISNHFGLQTAQRRSG